LQSRLYVPVMFFLEGKFESVECAIWFESRRVCQFDILQLRVFVKARSCEEEDERGQHEERRTWMSQDTKRG